MKRTSSLLILSLIFIVKANGQFTYLNPKPNASFINPQTTIAIKNGELIDEASLRKKEFIAITGSLSGKHAYSSRLSDDGKTIIVHPTPIFKCGETVTVELYSNRLKKKSGELIQGTSFSFQIREEITAEQEKKYKQALMAFYSQEDMDGDNSSADLRTENLDSLPTYAITTNTNPAPGQIFFKNINNFLPVDTNGFATIIENNGDVTWAHKLKTAGMDFKINYNGYITYFDDSTKYWIVLDSNYEKIDSLQCGNGLAAYVNSHDVAMYSDKHSLVLVNDVRTMDLTQYGGKSNATVTGIKIQELDSAKDVIWEWNGWDYFNVDDAVSTVIITGYLVDYVHSNSVSRDNDGNIILSSRNLDELTKINRNTDSIIWRLNGENNQFTFINDNIAEHFIHQHDAHRISNGNLMLFNNANFLSPQKSSSKEYALDETNKTATLIWYYE
ncbi:MAG: aryl-sulfate sulfotransferase, partial [Chitinophagales bacterium]|nr:aryl-sulfate sulfotransferase [Chitinophagales bacterium]